MQAALLVPGGDFRGPGLHVRPHQIAQHPDLLLGIELGAQVRAKLGEAAVVLGGAADGKVALVRLEQLAPFPEKVLEQELARYSKTARYVWCQEEARNMGAWFFLRARDFALFALAESLPNIVCLGTHFRRSHGLPAGLGSLYEFHPWP